jgi:predicted acetyltransferase
MNLPLYGKPDGDSDARVYADIAAQSFAMPPSHARMWVGMLGQDSFRVIRDGADVQGGLALLPMGQFFGGRRVESCGIAAVAVLPHLRGRGIATTLMRSTLHEMADMGVAVSTLYSASNALYGGQGWSIAGTRTRYDIPGPLIAATRKAGQGLRAIQDPNAPEIREIYGRFAASSNGMLDRHEAIWASINRAEEDKPLYGVLHDEGYLLYAQTRHPGATNHEIEIRDFAWLTPQAGAALASAMAGQGTQVSTFTLWCHENEPLLEWLLPEMVLPVAARQYWMLRIVNADKALQQRGWPAGLSTEFTFTLKDDVLEGQSGPRTVRVRDGSAEVERAATGAGPELDVRGLSALFSGLRAPAELRRLGLLSGDDSRDGLLAAAFAGPSPALHDFF